MGNVKVAYKAQRGGAASAQDMQMIENFCTQEADYQVFSKIYEDSTEEQRSAITKACDNIDVRDFQVVQDWWAADASDVKATAMYNAVKVNFPEEPAP